MYKIKYIDDTQNKEIEVNFSSSRDIDLSGKNLHQVFLDNQCIIGNFKESKIRSGIFVNIVFIDCDFSESKFISLRFINAFFVNCNFENAGLLSCGFENCCFIDTPITDISLLKNVEFTKCNLNQNIPSKLLENIILLDDKFN